ncbi:sodium-dependent bicarbonate transport family permease [Roseibium denhamense]|uniref:sodium-dependent bicarbonate transport family permease n=1 Tax=Roseibium denhamense TaxID=76305 RepID=UPI0024B7FB45|nr:sodium-dependent bicarbonate transport family permease [Roseibium denhamense]MTI04476.1 sodium-dependent bicarbonate transport family permease [Roseibium denhamense]
MADTVLTLAATNLLSPIILFFALGLGAALVRSDLSVPEAAAKALSIYLLFAIGFKGGVSVASHGVDSTLLLSLVAGTVLSFAIPFAAFGLLRVMTQLGTIDAAAVAGHYGSISIVTFVAATSVLQSQGIASEGYMVAVAAAMEAPAILSALWIAARYSSPKEQADQAQDTKGLYREILLNGSIVLLLGSFAIGLISGPKGLADIESFIVSPFKGVLCLFLLDMGLVAGRGLRASAHQLRPGLILFGILMPVLGSLAGLAAALLIGLSPGGTVLLMTLSASASYIAVPAAMRVALPDANPAIYLTMSLGITFPFNLTVGIPLYLTMAQAFGG